MSSESLKTLLLLDPSVETMDGIVRRMEALRGFFYTNAHYKPLMPFLEVYYRVTKAVLVEQAAGSGLFRNSPALERLDVYFASLYFNALYSFLSSGECVAPWRTYFEYCVCPHGNAFLQMLLGISAHINGDLSGALIRCSYAEREDFLLINSILERQIRSMLVYLAYTHADVVSFGAWLFPRATASLFKTTIVSWRDRAWRHAEQKADNAIVHIRAEELATQLIGIFAKRRHLLRISQLKERLAQVSAHV